MNFSQPLLCFHVKYKTRESSLDCKEIQPVHPKGDQSWVFLGRSDAKAETPILWPPHAKSWLIGKDLDAGGDWGQEEKGMTEDKMAGWHHQLDGHEFEWTPGVGDGQEGLVCCVSWGRKESDTIEQLDWAELMHIYISFCFCFSEKLLLVYTGLFILEEWPWCLLVLSWFYHPTPWLVFNVWITQSWPAFQIMRLVNSDSSGYFALRGTRNPLLLVVHLKFR